VLPRFVRACVGLLIKTPGVRAGERGARPRAEVRLAGGLIKVV
jgi:hypothetical protein